MVKVNKELQMMIDNASIVRGSQHTKNAREGRILTFQANIPITIQINSQESIFESVNSKGLPYVEYRYHQNTTNSNLQGMDLLKNNPNKSR